MNYHFTFFKAVFSFFIIFILLIISIKNSDAGSGIETPVKLEGGQIINAEQARKLQQSGKALFFDMRSPVNYGKGHIPTAKPLPYRENSAKAIDFQFENDFFDFSKLPEDKKETIVFYSHGTTGWKSYKAAVVTIGSGYRGVRWLRGGLQSWEKAGFPLAY